MRTLTIEASITRAQARRGGGGRLADLAGRCRGGGLAGALAGVVAGAGGPVRRPAAGGQPALARRDLRGAAADGVPLEGILRHFLVLGEIPRTDGVGVPELELQSFPIRQRQRPLASWLRLLALGF